MPSYCEMEFTFPYIEVLVRYVPYTAEADST